MRVLPCPFLNKFVYLFDDKQIYFNFYVFNDIDLTIQLLNRDFQIIYTISHIVDVRIFIKLFDAINTKTSFYSGVFLETIKGS